MKNSMLCQFANWFGFQCRQPRKRKPLAHSWSPSLAERLEERALLSASGVAADVDSLDDSGDKGASRHQKAASPKAVNYPSVDGNWDLTFSSTLGSASGILEITQVPVAGRKFTGEANTLLGSLTLKGKFDKKDVNDGFGKVTLKPADGGTIKLKFRVTFTGNFTEFNGTATSNRFPDVDLDGVRDLPSM